MGGRGGENARATASVCESDSEGDGFFFSSSSSLFRVAVSLARVV
jgi:hypothetical protein